MINYPTVIEVLQHKGGVGKTTLTMNIGAALALRGARVVLIDADPQGSLTKALKQERKPGMIGVLAMDQDWEQWTLKLHPELWAGKVHRQPQGKLYLVPGHRHNRVLPTMLGDNMFGADYTRLRDRLEELAGFADVVLIDTNPTPSMMHGLAYLASDYIIIPTQAESLSLEGVLESTRALIEGKDKRAEHGIPPYRLLGYQVNMFDAQLKDHNSHHAALVKKFGADSVWQPISDRTVWKEASSRRCTLFAFNAKGHQADAKDIAIAELSASVDRTIKAVSA